MEQRWVGKRLAALKWLHRSLISDNCYLAIPFLNQINIINFVLKINYFLVIFSRRKKKIADACVEAAHLQTKTRPSNFLNKSRTRYWIKQSRDWRFQRDQVLYKFLSRRYKPPVRSVLRLIFAFLYFFILEKRELRTDQMGCGGSKAAQVSLVKVKQIEDRPSGQDEPDPWVYAQVRFEKITLALKILGVFMRAIFEKYR